MKIAHAITAMLVSAVALAACSPVPEEGDAQEAAEATPVIEADPGETAFMQCAACHSIEQGEPNKLGPNLAGVFGRKAGSGEDFSYSEAMAGSGIVWSRETLDAFLKSPAALVPGTKMVFAGVPDDASRQQLVDYLESQSGAGQQ